MTFLQYLEGHYENEGCQVYSRHLPHLSVGPPDWKGPLPDMVVEKDGDRIAVFCLMFGEFADSLDLDLWRRTLENDRTKLRIFVRQKSDLATLRRILEQANISAELGVAVRHSASSFMPRHVSVRRIVRSLVVLAVIVIIALLVLWFGSYLYTYDPSYHEPRDLEREATEGEQ